MRKKRAAGKELALALAAFLATFKRAEMGLRRVITLPAGTHPLELTAHRRRTALEHPGNCPDAQAAALPLRNRQPLHIPQMLVTGSHRSAPFQTTGSCPVALTFGTGQAAEKFGLLGRISQIGIQDFRDDSKRYDHKEDFENSEELEIFVFGSSDFFRTRFDIIKRRLVSGKGIKVVVHEDRHDGIKKLLEMLKIHEVYDECVVNLKVFCQPKAPRYNYIKTDSGIWVKSYFMNTKDLEYGAPAFFIEKDTQLYGRYMKDLSGIIETELAGENLENFVATVS